MKQVQCLAYGNAQEIPKVTLLAALVGVDWRLQSRERLEQSLPGGRQQLRSNDLSPHTEVALLVNAQGQSTGSKDQINARSTNHCQQGTEQEWSDEGRAQMGESNLVRCMYQTRADQRSRQGMGSGNGKSQVGGEQNGGRRRQSDRGRKCWSGGNGIRNQASARKRI